MVEIYPFIDLGNITFSAIEFGSTEQFYVEVIVWLTYIRNKSEHKPSIAAEGGLLVIIVKPGPSNAHIFFPDNPPPLFHVSLPHL